MGGIANKYNVFKSFKKANGLKSDMIREGKVLTIPTKGTQSKSSIKTEYIPIELQPSLFSNDYICRNAFRKNCYCSKSRNWWFCIKRIGFRKREFWCYLSQYWGKWSKTSDFNKFRLFNEQLPVLNPDLVVISLGTNESFDKQSEEQYFAFRPNDSRN